MTDLATGLYAHGAILAALLQRLKTNEGQWIQCNLLSTQVASLINIGSNYLNSGKEARRWGSEHESLVPYEAFPTKDGYITIGTGSDKQFCEFLGKLGLSELETNPKFKTNLDRVEHRVELLKILRHKMKEKTNQEWSGILEGSSFPYGQINTLEQVLYSLFLFYIYLFLFFINNFFISQVFQDPHIKHIKLVQEIDHPITGKMKLVGPAVDYSFAENKIRSPPPVLGQHTFEVLKNVLNYSKEAIEHLKITQVIH